ncbi:MAG: ATP/GTP-binding protein [Candidatus Njordarchaeia archaeon]
MYVVGFLGTAGSGKSALTKSLGDYLDDKGEDFAIINLDPGTLDENIPYDPDINIRKYIKAEEIMASYKLGPNGAMIASMDLMTRYIENLRKEITDIDPEYLLIDTPGQMEIFAYRPIGSLLLKSILSIPDTKTSIVFIFDPYLCTISPNTLLSIIFLSISVFWRFGLPQINVLSKIDLFDEEIINSIIEQIRDPIKIFDRINEYPLRDESLGLIDLLKIENLFKIDIIPVSALTGDGMIDLFSELLNSWSETG